MAKTKKPPGEKKPAPDPEPEKKSVADPGKKTQDKRPLPELPKSEKESASSKESSRKSSLPGTEEEEKILDDIDILEVCKDLASLVFEGWRVFDKGIEPLDEAARKRLAKPMARIAYRLDIQKYMKDEFMLIFVFGLEISKRIKIKKKNVKNDNREKGSGENDPGHGVH